MRSAVAADPDRATSVRLAIDAMATRFELVLPADAAGGGRLRTIGEEALAEIARLEAGLSFYQAASEITWINAHAGERAVTVNPLLFALLQRCVALSAATAGAFDISVGPLMRAWQFTGPAGAQRQPRPLPSPGLVADARARVGYEHLDLDPHASSVRFGRSGMSIDLGAAGKGYAVGAAIGVLRGHGVTSALLHGGTSSVHAIGAPPDAAAWTVAWHPPGGAARQFALRDSALSVSAPHGKAFTSDGRLYGHVIDPRTGWPADAAASALVTGPESLECDALSTALLVLGAGWIPTLRARFPGYDAAAG